MLNEHTGIMELNLAEITINQDLNVREELDNETIERYAESFEQLPPVVVFETDSIYLLADGFHRYEAAKKLGREKINSEIRPGGYDDAQEYAAIANLKHGKPLTRAERRKAVERILKLHPERASNWIAQDMGVSENTVKKYREELEGNSQIEKCSTFITQDGREFPREAPHPKKSEQVSPIEDEQPKAEKSQLYCDERFCSLEDIQKYVGETVEVTVSAGHGSANVIKRGKILDIIEKDSAFMLDFETDYGEKRQFPTGTTTGAPTDEGIVEIRLIDQPAEVAAPDESEHIDEVEDESDKSENPEDWEKFNECWDWIRDYALDLAKQGDVNSASRIRMELEFLIERLDEECAETEQLADRKI